MNDALSLRRNSTSAATSVSVPSRPAACSCSRAESASADSDERTSGVSMKPGPTAFVRTPCAVYSSAATFVSPTSACFDAT